MEESKRKEFELALRAEIKGDVSFDDYTLGIYATDASIFQITPVAVVLPRDEQDVISAVKIAEKHNVSIVPRGGGTSLGGQAAGTSLVIDFSKYMNNILEVNEKEKLLRAIEVILPESVKYMFGRVLAKERQSLARAIKKCVESQIFFAKPQTREQLMNSSYAKICQFKVDLTNNARHSDNSKEPKAEVITFLHQLADLKALFEQYNEMGKQLSKPPAKVSVHDILTFMFNVVSNNMYRPQWRH